MQGNIDICHFNLKIVISIIISSVRYTHHSIQNEVIEIFRQMILGSIRDDIHNVRWFSVMADETRDVGKIEQMLFCLWFVRDGSQREEFIQFSPVSDLTAAGLAEQIITSLRIFGVDLQFTAAQCYDGASTMSGCRRGVQKLYFMCIVMPCIEDAKPSGPQVIWNNIAKEAADLVKEHDLPSPAERPRRKVRIDIVPQRIMITKSDFRDQLYRPCLLIELQERFSPSSLDV